MSTPHVSGVAALLLSYRPSASLEAVYNAMACSAIDMGSAGYDTTYGFGIVDALGAMMQMNSSNPCTPTRPTTTFASVANSNTNIEGSCVPVDATIQTDKNGYQDSYSLMSTTGEVIWMNQKLTSNKIYKEHACVDPNGCYQFQISDSGGDGIPGGGLTLSYNGTNLFSGGNFGYGGWLKLGGGC